MSLFENKLAVVFGGGRDIGRAVAIDLAKNGAQVAFSYNSGGADETLAAIKAVGGTGWAFQVDAMDTKAIRAFAAVAAKQAGKDISVLVNVVGGIVARKRMEEMDDAFWEQVMNLNVRSTFAMTQAAIPLMHDGAAIVNFSSLAGRDGGGGGAIAYSSSKGALMAFTRGLAKELGPRKIRVNAVNPGLTLTEGVHTAGIAGSDFEAEAVKNTPLGRAGQPQDIASVVAFLASDDAGWVTGSLLQAGGGLRS